LVQLHSIELLKTLYHATAPLWFRASIWEAEATLSNPLLYVVLAGVLFLEWRMPAVRQQRPLSTGLCQDFFWFLGDRIIWLGALALTSHSIRLFYQAHLSFLTVDIVHHLPRAVRIVFALLLFDFFDWGRHYLKHKTWWLWAFHSVHHSQREMNIFTDARVHVLERAINMALLFIPLSMFQVGVPTDFYIAIGLTWYRMIYHANIRTNFGPLKYVLVTPQFHRIHHSSDLRHADTNFGVIFTFWDRLFGTHWDDHDEYPRTGITDDRFPFEQSSKFAVLGNWVRQTAYPLFALFRHVRPAASGE
jgi:sterol desaturase/sphingolipid hydroxylase (fatty acid hydroxylase superfamily)